MTTLHAGDTVEGRYRIIRELDRGGMGTVFLAEHELIKRKVALKLLRAELAEDADVLERFMNEARAAGTLGHPNIVESTDMGFTRDGVPYIVFEFLEGSLLSTEIYRVHGLPVRRALRIARQIASALNAAHSAGVVHRDLKTDNVFLTDREEAADHVKVLDFGVSRFQEGDDSATSRAMVVGTPEFMAPEQITDPEAVDQRTDIYALGVILYEMLAARRPFADTDPDVLFERILAESPPALGIDEIPPGLETMLMERFLAKRPEDRFATMRDVEAALAAFAGIVRPVGRDSAPIPIATPQGMPEVAAVVAVQPPRRRASVAWLAAALVAGAAGAALLVVDRGPEHVTDPNIAFLHDDADKLVATVDSTIRGAQARIEGLAQAPMLRAGIETDAQTIHDMFQGDFKLQLNAGELFELLQQQGSAAVVMIRVPDGPPLAHLPDHGARLRVTPKGLDGVVTTPVTTQRGELGGEIALEVPIDLSDVKRQLATRASNVALVGLEPPLALVAAGSAIGTRVEVPVAFGNNLGAAKLTATLPPLPPPPPPTLLYVRLSCWALGGLLVLVYLGAMLRARQR